MRDQATEGVALTTTMALLDLQTLQARRLCNTICQAETPKHTPEEPALEPDLVQLGQWGSRMAAK